MSPELALMIAAGALPVAVYVGLGAALLVRARRDEGRGAPNDRRTECAGDGARGAANGR